MLFSGELDLLCVGFAWHEKDNRGDAAKDVTPTQHRPCGFIQASLIRREVLRFFRR